MQVEIKNFRGISSGVLPLTKHAFVAGPNGSGKTSISMALSAAFSGSAVPWVEVKAKDAKCLLRDGAKRGHVMLTDGEQTVNINYPGGSVSGEFKGIASSIALGLHSVATMKQADATTVLAGYMGAKPALDDLIEAVGEATAKQIWPVIDAEGWDAALERAKESGSRLKGQWEGIAGENWGSAKAHGWMPQGADAYDLTGDLAAKVHAAHDHHQNLLSNRAVGADRIQRLLQDIDAGKAATQWLELQEGISDGMTADDCENAVSALKTVAEEAAERIKRQGQIENWRTLAAKLPESLRAKAALEESVVEHALVLKDARSALSALPQPTDTVQTAPCPSCGTHVIVVSRSALKMPEEQLTEEGNLKRKTAIDAAQKVIAEAQAAHDADLAALNAVTAEVATQQKAVDALDATSTEDGQVAEDEIPQILERAAVLSEAVTKLKAVAAAGQAANDLEKLEKQQQASPEEVEAAARALHDAETALSIRQQIEKASKYAETIAKNGTIVTALSPTGVRQTVLARALEYFNQKLSEVCKTARWETVAVTENMRITFGSREYGWQLSESEKFRARVALQFVMASLDRSTVVVVDAADILDSKGRNGILALIKGAERTVIMTMTMNRKEDVPNLEKLGLSSFWINEAGEIEPV